MKNLFAFFRKIRFLLFFLILQIVSFYFIRSGEGVQKASIVNSANDLTGWFYEQDRAIKDYFFLKEINKRLIIENIRLRKYVIKNYHKISTHEIQLNDSIFHLKFQYTPAQVIKNMVSSKYNMLTLNVGSRNGIKPEMGVITQDGIVGFVKDVSENFSTVIPAMNQQFNITAKSTTQNLFGTFVWRDNNSFNEGTVEKVPNYIKLKKGDTLVTTTYEQIFPEGEPVGIVTDIFEEPGSNYKTVKVKTCTDFYNLNTVYVISNNLKAEFDSIQNPQP